MKKRLIFFLIMVCGSFSLSASSDSDALRDIWLRMKNVDDHEKNFRFASFTDSLLLLASQNSIENVKEMLPSEWTTQVSSDTSLFVMAAVLPYRFHDSKLIYLINTEGNYHLFHKSIETVDAEITEPIIEIEKTTNDELDFYRVMMGLNNRVIEEIPDVMIKLLFNYLVQAREDSEKDRLSEEIWLRLSSLMKKPNWFSSDFDGFKKMSTLISQDGQIKLCTWNVEYFNGDNIFHGGVVVKGEDELMVHRLTDQHFRINTPEQADLNVDQWFGCVYYDIIGNQKEGETIYTLLGYNPHNAFTKIRVVEILTVDNNGVPQFGYPVFEGNHIQKQRLIYEYSIRANMMLRYDQDQEMIVMDNLASFDPVYGDDPRYMGPDFTHNGLKFENGKWVFYDEIDLRNPRPRRRQN